MILLKFLLILILYPAIMSMYWTIGSSLYFIRYELFSKSHKVPSDLKGGTFVVACFNEHDTLEETLTSLVHLDYPLKEIIMVNDGSTDYTAAKLTILKSRYDFKFINLKENKGKANALNEAVKEASYNYVLCIDADTVIFDGAPQYMMAHMLNDKSIGAVTGNPRIRNEDYLVIVIAASILAFVIFVMYFNHDYYTVQSFAGKLIPYNTMMFFLLLGIAIHCKNIRLFVRRICDTFLIPNLFTSSVIS